MGDAIVSVKTDLLVKEENVLERTVHCASALDLEDVGQVLSILIKKAFVVIPYIFIVWFVSCEIICKFNFNE